MVRPVSERSAENSAAALAAKIEATTSGGSGNEPSAPAEVSRFDPARLAACLGPTACRLDVEVLAECDSTNNQLLQKISANAAGVVSGQVLVADRQTAGRGRRGRQWISAQQSPDDSLTFSLLWRFAPGVDLSGLSLAVGLALSEAIAGFGSDRVRLKWPNDLLVELPEAGRVFAKLGGILIELVSSGRGAGGALAVIGVGINLRAPASGAVDQAAAGLDALLPEGLPEHHQLFAELLRQLVTTLDCFAGQGFAPFRSAWEARNAFAGRRVMLIEESGRQISGECLGVDVDGALRVDTENGPLRWLAGDVSLRAA